MTTSPDAERSILHAILLNEEAIARVEFLQAEMFSSSVYQHIYTAMRDLYSAQKPIDEVTIAEKSGIPIAKITPAFEAIAKAPGLLANVAEHGRIVRDHHRRREVVEAGHAIVKAAENVNVEVAAMTGRVQEILSAASGTAEPDTLRSLSQAILEVHADLDGTSNELKPVLTGFRELDRMAGGLHPGLLTVIAGRPAMGKSAFAANIAANASLNGAKTLFVSLEDTCAFLTKRILARHAQVPYDALVRSTVRENQWTPLSNASRDLYDCPLWIDDGAGQTLSDVRATVAGLRMREGLDLVIIDHLGEMARDDDEYATTSLVAKGARDMAKDFNLPVVLISQLNRSVESRPDKRPMMSDLRGSGKIEEAARAIWFLYRHSYYSDDTDGEQGTRENEMQVLIAKQTHGECGWLPLSCDLSTMTIGDLK